MLLKIDSFCLFKQTMRLLVKVWSKQVLWYLAKSLYLKKYFNLLKIIKFLVNIRILRRKKDIMGGLIMSAIRHRGSEPIQTAAKSLLEIGAVDIDGNYIERLGDHFPDKKCFLIVNIVSK